MNPKAFSVKKTSLILFSFSWSASRTLESKDWSVTEFSKPRSFISLITIEANKFIYNKIKNIVDADGNTFIEDLIEDYKIRSEKVTYYKDFEKFVTTGETNAKIESKYTIKSKDVTFLKKDKELSSKKYSTIEDNNFQIYNLDEFVFFADKKILKGKKSTNQIRSTDKVKKSINWTLKK